MQKYTFVQQFHRDLFSSNILNILYQTLYHTKLFKKVTSNGQFLNRRISPPVAHCPDPQRTAGGGEFPYKWGRVHVPSSGQQTSFLIPGPKVSEKSLRKSYTQKDFYVSCLPPFSPSPAWLMPLVRQWAWMPSVLQQKLSTEYPPLVNPNPSSWKTSSRSCRPGASQVLTEPLLTETPLHQSSW